MAEVQSYVPGVSLRDVRERLRLRTQQLLGITMLIDDEGWHEPSRLPGWTRAHVATHVARNADAMSDLCAHLLAGEQPRYRPGDLWDIERGSERSGLELQIDLDTSAKRLNDAFDAVAERPSLWDAPITLPCGMSATSNVLPLLRLAELEIHMTDVGVGIEMADIDPEVARWIVHLQALRLEHFGYPGFTIECTCDHVVHVGRGGPIVRGDHAALLAWLTDRSHGEGLTGHEQITLPSLRGEA